MIYIQVLSIPQHGSLNPASLLFASVLDLFSRSLRLATKSCTNRKFATLSNDAFFPTPFQPTH